MTSVEPEKSFIGELCFLEQLICLFGQIDSVPFTDFMDLICTSVCRELSLNNGYIIDD